MPVYDSTYQVKSSKGMMYRFEFKNFNGEFARFSINGQEIVPTKEDEDKVVEAFTALDTAICRMAVNRIQLEEAFKK